MIIAPGDLCAQIGNDNIKVIFKNMLPYPVELYEMKNSGAERVQKDFDEEDYLTLVTAQSKRYLFRRQNEEKSLGICVSGKAEYLFKGSHFGISCEKPIVLQIFEESKVRLTYGIHYISKLLLSKT